MSNFITLADFHAEAANYYLYRRTESPVSFMPHYHDYHQVSFVSSGEIRHSQGGDSVTLHAGDAFIVPPGFVHRVHFVGERSELYTLAFHEALFQSDLVQSKALRFLKDLQSQHEASTIHLCLTLDAGQQNCLQALIQSLQQQQDADYPAELSAAPSIVSAIINLLSQCYYRNPKNTRQPWNSADNAQLLRRCIAYVNTHYAEPIGQDELARRFGLSRASLCSAFQQHTGLSIHKYIAQKRIEKAQMLIRSQAATPLNEIAVQVGYEDTSTFYRNFLKITGVTPSRYRELCHRKEKA